MANNNVNKNLLRESVDFPENITASLYEIGESTGTYVLTLNPQLHKNEADKYRSMIHELRDLITSLQYKFDRLSKNKKEMQRIHNCDW